MCSYCLYFMLHGRDKFTFFHFYLHVWRLQFCYICTVYRSEMNDESLLSLSCAKCFFTFSSADRSFWGEDGWGLALFIILFCRFPCLILGLLFTFFCFYAFNLSPYVQYILQEFLKLSNKIKFGRSWGGSVYLLFKI